MVLDGGVSSYAESDTGDRERLARVQDTPSTTSTTIWLLAKDQGISSSQVKIWTSD